MPGIDPIGSPRRKLLDAALHVIRAQGYAGATVDDICRAAGVTKGSFFHHFKGKDDLALAAVRHWSDWTQALFAQAPYHAIDDARERVLAYIAFRGALITGDVANFTCPLGVLLQEGFETHPVLREACREAIAVHLATVEAMLRDARDACPPDADWMPADVAAFTQAALQGGFILAKAEGRAEPARRVVDNLHRYIALLLARTA